MTTRRKFTQEEDLVILRNLQQYPDNIHHAFIKTNEELPSRSIGVISARYYRILRTKEDFKAISVGSKEGFTHNIKNTMRIEGNFPEDRSLKTVEWLMKQFLDLSKQDRDKIFSFFVSTGSIAIEVKK